MAQSEGKKNLNKKIFYIVCAMVFTFGLLLSALTLAFFSSRDEVTNKTSASDVEIALLEPEWYDHGMTDAKTLEPGMVVDKNPQVLNKSENAVYVRMRVRLIDSNGNVIPSNDEKYEKIMSAICFEQNDDRINSVQLVKTATDDILVSQNPCFQFIGNDDWFYYYKDDKFTALDAGAKTPELFSCLKIPVRKTEYARTFDSNFSIEVEAQAISASVDETGKNKEKILNAFYNLSI